MMKCLFSILVFVLANIQCLERGAGAAEDALKNGLVNKSNADLPLMNSKINNAGVDVEIEDYRGRVCLKNITECRKNGFGYRSTTDRLSTILFSSMPPFDLSKVSGVTQKCREHSQKYVEDLKKFQYWALQMYDASAKLPSGLLNGNVNQFGDFDMCLTALSDDFEIRGQYCLAYMEVQPPRNTYLMGLYQLVHAHHHFKSKLEDPGHRVPRFSTIQWALCVPASCDAEDVELGLETYVDEMLDGTDLRVRYQVDPSMCQKKNDDERLPTSSRIVLAIFGLVFLWELIATLYDQYAVGEKNEWMTAFSLKENFLSCISLKRSADDIQAVHGIRCLNATLLLASHKSMAAFFLPYTNRTAFVEYMGRPFSVIGRAASLYTDPFIMLSGTLTTYSLLPRLPKARLFEVARREYVSRLFRIVPAFAALIAICTFILPWAGEGPLWNLVVTHHSDICKRHWWRNLLFVHNYFGFKDMCLTHTHHIGIDTQLFLVSPFLVYVLWRWPKRGSILLVALATISTIMRFYVSYTMRLSNYVHFGTSLEQLFQTADNMYILPAHRATVYIMGIGLGYILRYFSHIQMTKFQLNVGNAVALFSFCVSIIGPSFMSNIDYEYHPIDAAWYAALSPILWCLSFAWIIFTWHLGYRSLPGRIFSDKLFTMWTKISYTVYLVQFPVYFFNVGRTHSPSEANFFTSIFNLKEYLWVLVLSLLLTLTVEMPFQKVRRILLRNQRSKKIVGQEGSDKKHKVS